MRKIQIDHMDAMKYLVSINKLRKSGWTITFINYGFYSVGKTCTLIKL